MRCARAICVCVCVFFLCGWKNRNSCKIKSFDICSDIYVSLGWLHAPFHLIYYFMRIQMHNMSVEYMPATAAYILYQFCECSDAVRSMSIWIDTKINILDFSTSVRPSVPIHSIIFVEIDQIDWLLRMRSHRPIMATVRTVVHTVQIK